MAHEALFNPGVSFKDGRLYKVNESAEGNFSESFVSTSDTKQFFTSGIKQFFMNDPEVMDTGWQELYTVVPSSNHGELFPFRNPDPSGSGVHGIVFEQVNELGDIQYSKVTANEKYVKAVKYGTAIGYSNEWFEDGSMGMIEMTTRDFRQAHHDKMAAIHYGAITTAVSSGVSLSSAIGGTEVNDFNNALHDATVTMRRNKRNPSIILQPPETEMFVDVALKTRYGFLNQATSPSTSANQPATGGEPTHNSRYRKVVTEHLAAGASTSTVYIIEPKTRMVSVDREPLTLGDFDDLIKDAHSLVGKFRRGVLVGEGQVIRAITGVPHAVPVS